MRVILAEKGECLILVGPWMLQFTTDENASPNWKRIRYNNLLRLWSDDELLRQGRDQPKKPRPEDVHKAKQMAISALTEAFGRAKRRQRQLQLFT